MCVCEVVLYLSECNLTYSHLLHRVHSPRPARKTWRRRSCAFIAVSYEASINTRNTRTFRTKYWRTHCNARLQFVLQYSDRTGVPRRRVHHVHDSEVLETNVSCSLSAPERQTGGRPNHPEVLCDSEVHHHYCHSAHHAGVSNGAKDALTRRDKSRYSSVVSPRTGSCTRGRDTRALATERHASAVKPVRTD